MYAENTEIGNPTLSEQDRWNLQGDLHQLSDWLEKWKMPFNVNRCQILQIGSKIERWTMKCAVLR